MPERSQSLRLTESRLARFPGILLCILWIASMSAVDSSACTLPPALWILIAIVGISAIAILIGYKVVRLTLTAWLSLVAGTYYLIRALSGFSLTENWTDAGLVLSAIIFYIAGAYTGQQSSNKNLVLVLCCALLLNLLYFYLMRDEAKSLRWLGRADIGLSGPHTRNTSLFVYKNFAGLFFILSGMLLVWNSIWRGFSRRRNFIYLLIGLIGIVASAFCGTRIIWFALPLLIVAGWLLLLIIRLYSKHPVGWLTLGGCVTLLITLLVLAADFFFSNNTLKLFTELNSHCRYDIWDCICRVAPQAPPWGFGPGGSQWEIITLYRDGQLPNYAHNEYLQMWADYGFIGIAFLLLLLVLHLAQGFRILANDYISPTRRERAAMALLTILTISGAAIADYPWHNMALLSMTTFAAGTLAAPFPHQPLHLFEHRNWAPGSEPAPIPVRAETACGRTIIVAAAATIITLMVKLSATLTPAWLAQWKYDAMIKQGADYSARRSFLLSTITFYPDSAMMDHFITMAPGGTQPDWNTYEQGLRTALQANPRQLITAATLAQVLSKQGKYEEAERTFRLYYPDDGPNNNRINSWATFYAVNLLKWGRHEMLSGSPGKARSLLTYAENLAKKCGYYPGNRYRTGTHSWTQGGSPEMKQFVKSCRTDLNTLKLIDIPTDDSWQSPLSQGEPHALYQRYQQQTQKQ